MLGGFLIPVQWAYPHRVHSLSVISWHGPTLNVPYINISEFTFCALCRTALRFETIEPYFHFTLNQYININFIQTNYLFGASCDVLGGCTLFMIMQKLLSNDINICVKES